MRINVHGVRNKNALKVCGLWLLLPPIWLGFLIVQSSDDSSTVVVEVHT